MRQARKTGEMKENILLWFFQLDNNLQYLIFTIGQQIIIFDFYNWTTISQIWFTIGQQFPIIDLQFDNNIQSLNFTIGQGFTILNQWFSIYNCGPSNTIVPCAGYHVVHRFWNLKLKQITDFFLSINVFNVQDVFIIKYEDIDTCLWTWNTPQK